MLPKFPHLRWMLQKLRVLPPEKRLTQYREMLPKRRVRMLQKPTETCAASTTDNTRKEAVSAEHEAMRTVRA